MPDPAEDSGKEIAFAWNGALDAMAGKSNGLSLSEQAYRRIKHKIISLELPPGSVINESELREELELGRTPIREALQRLSQEMLVEIIPRRGMFVTEIGIMDLQRLFEMRVELEALAARLAAQRGTEEQWAMMEAQLSSVPTEGEPADNQTLVALDETFHRLIYEAADNKFLKDTLVTLYTLSLRLWYLSLPSVGGMRDALLEHKVILDALRSGDAERASEVLGQHIKGFQEKIQAVMLGQLAT